MTHFETGATRDTDTGKLDYEGFLSPAVLKRFAEYIHENRVQADGNLRASDNWQKGIPQDAYMKSMFRRLRPPRESRMIRQERSKKISPRKLNVCQ